MPARTDPQRARGPDRRHGHGLAPGAAERRRPDDRRRHGYLSLSPLFENLPYRLIEAAIDGCPVRRLAAGEVLLESGRKNETMYLVLSGRLDVRLAEEDAADTIPIGPGGTLGEMSIIDEQPVSATVSAGEAAEVVTIPARVFWDELLQVPGFARNLARVLSSRMRASNDRVVARLREHLALEHLQKELQIARNIQAGMLPGRGRLFGEREDIDVCGLMDAAQDIGGDLYDAFFVGPHTLVAAVGDVSGKGIPAALFMARVVAQLRLVAMSEASPEAVLARLNQLLCEHNDAGMFVTLLYFVLDVRSGEYRYSNAGHNPPFALRGAGGGFLPLPRGLVAGMVAQARYAGQHGMLAPGETLLLYTDGVTEAMNPAMEIYGESRLALAASGAPDASALIAQVRRSVDAFATGAAQSDDITMLAVRRPA